MRTEGRQNLLVDADDTLWENHAYFLQVHARFLEHMEQRGHDSGRVAAKLRQIEGERTRSRGYGSTNFAWSLVETVEDVNGGIEDAFREEILAEGRWIHDHPVELFPGVKDTLCELATRHDLLLVTKGDEDEQRAKLERSGLAGIFSAAEILPEKTRTHYLKLGERHGLDPDTTWMIGNSPRSDINPARQAGFKTVHIPHRSLWEFEAEDLHDRPDLALERFRDLLDHF